MGEGAFDTTQFGEALQAADGRVTGLGAARQIVEDFLAVIRPHGDPMILAPFRPAPRFFRHERGDHRDHVRRALQMFVLEEGAGHGIGVAGDIA